MLAQRVLLGVLLIPAGALGAVGPLHGEPQPPATTLLEQGPLGRAAVVAVVEVEEVHDVVLSRGGLGQQIALCRVLEALKGPEAQGARVAVKVVGHRPTLDPRQPSIPYFKRGVKGRFVAFLGQREDGHAYDLIDLYAARGPDAEGRLAAVRAAARLARIEEAGLKARETLAWLLEALGSEHRWLQGHAARDAHHLLSVAPAAFDARARERLGRIAGRVRDPDARWWLGRLLERLRDEAGAAPLGPRHDPWERAFLALVTTEERLAAALAVLEEPQPFEQRRARVRWIWAEAEPSLRRALVEATAARHEAAWVAEWRLRYPGEEDPEVREALVRAVGILGSAADVPWLIERSHNPRLLRPALVALARRATPEARARLEAVARAMEQGGALAPDVPLEWLRWLCTEGLGDPEGSGGR